MRLKIAMGLSALAFGLGAAACGSTDIRSTQISEPRESIAAAEEAGAKDVPKAAYHLKLAEDRLVVADKFMREGETDQARLVLQQATADAELALAMARLETTRGKARGSLQDIQQMRSE